MTYRGLGNGTKFALLSHRGNAVGYMEDVYMQPDLSNSENDRLTLILVPFRDFGGHFLLYFLFAIMPGNVTMFNC